MATEKRLIDANALDSILESLEHGYRKAMFVLSANSISEIRKIVHAVRTVDAVEVVHGEWENNEYGFQCSKCGGDSLYDGFNHPVKSNYCPNCGAKMDGDGNGQA